MTIKRTENTRWLVVVAVVGAAMWPACGRQGALEEQLKEARADWTARLSSLRARQTTLAESARAAAPVPAGADRAIDAQAAARRLQVMEVSGQQAMADVDRAIEEEIRAIRAAGNPFDALLEARSRMAEYFAGQEAALSAAQEAITANDKRGAR